MRLLEAVIRHNAFACELHIKLQHEDLQFIQSYLIANWGRNPFEPSATVSAIHLRVQASNGLLQNMAKPRTW